MSNTTDKPTFHQTIDFDALMREARKHITALAGDLWSDHNSSDSGITQLEVLAFCIADLSYRTSFGIDDILTGYKGGKALDIDLPLVDAVLPNNPVSIKDLRKVLIDMAHPKYVESEGDPTIAEFKTKLLLRNAFPIIAEGTEIPFYAVSEDGKDSFLNFKDEYLFKQVSVASSTIQVTNSSEPDKELSEMGLKTASANTVQTATEQATERTVETIADADVLDGAIPDKTVVGDAINGLDALPGETITKTIKYNNIDTITLNGLYSIQLEFEDDLTLIQNPEDPQGDPIALPTYLKDLNQNYFEQLISVGDNEYTISVLLPYWDDIEWSLRKVDLDNTTIAYEKRDNQQDYFIAVDKLNYDDYFYEYYAELLLGEHLLTTFVKLKTEIRSAITVSGKTYEFSANFLDWNELSNGVNRNYGLVNSPNDAFDNVINVSIGAENIYDIQATFVLPENVATNTTAKNFKLLTRITFGADEDMPDYFLVAYHLEAAFKNLCEEQIELETAIHTQLKTVETNDIYHNYLDKINKVFNYLYEEPNNVWSYLGKYRNVGEDYSKFTASRVQEIALLGKILLAPNKNVNEVIAEIYFQVDKFLNPLIQFKTLSEMVDKGYRFDELFNGPLLKNGFIEDEDLNNLKRKAVIYTSDLIRIIMDVDGVEAVENFNISSYIDNRLMGRNVINCLSLTNSDVYKPRFSFDKSKLSICVDGEEEVWDTDAIREWYDKKIADQKATQIPVAKYYELEIPQGADMEIEAYQSIQHDFPELYGIGEFGLPLDATEERKAAAKQLKAYLLPFEQLLANYLKQVSHLPELFSYNKEVNNTYAFEPLYNVPDVEELFKDFVQGNDTWEIFKQGPNNGYQEIIEENAKTDFGSRRNRFLSHLLGRFGETFEKYATQLFNQHKELLNDFNKIDDYQAKRAEELDRLIGDKIAFGEDYSEVSGGRYNAFDTTYAQTVGLNHWQDDNIGAYKLRLCRLLGIKTTDNEFIFGTGAYGVDQEGMHIVEHILLRPRTIDSAFLPLNNRAGDHGIFIYDADKDPYSFKITIVLPVAAGRFEKEAYRKFVEELIQLETPAHIVIDFRWMSSSCGQKFEQHYSAWKKGIHKLKPYFFQNRETLTAEQQEELRTVYTVPDERETGFGKSILELQNNLTDALGSTCKLNLTLYDADDKGLVVQNGVIAFVQNETDVHHIKVSEIGGALTVYRWEGNWVMKQEFEPVEKIYFDVDEFIALTPKGLTTNSGGEGTYRVVYTLGEQSVAQQVTVTKAIIPVHIYIGWSIDKEGEMLAFDTETDGTFRISNQQWQGHFLQSLPAQSTDSELANPYGEVYISSIDNGLTPVLLGMSDGDIYLQDIYDKYRAGTYHITYELDGQSTFADIELYVEAFIHVFNVKQELTPNAEGIISIPADMRIIDLRFIPINGNLKVRDLSGVNSDSVIATYEEIGALTIDRDKEQVYKEGVNYEFTYEIDGAVANVILFFEKAEIEFPTITLIRKGKAQEGNNFVFTIEDAEVAYQIGLHPKDAVVSLLNRESGKLLDSFAIPSDQFVTEFNPLEIYKEHGTGPFLIENKNDAGTAIMKLYIDIVDQPTDTYVKILQDGKEVQAPEINVETNQHGYTVLCEPAGGVRTISKQWGDDTQLLDTVSIEDYNREEELDVESLYKKYGTGTYLIRYDVDGSQQEASFSLVANTPTDTYVKILQDGKEVQAPEINVETNQHGYTVLCEPAGGVRTISKQWGDDTQLLDTVPIEDHNREEELNVESLYKKHGIGTYLISYDVDGSQQEASFSLVDATVKELETIVENMGPIDLKIIDTGKNSEIEAVEGIHTLVYDYTNPGHAYEFAFSSYPGMLMLLDGDEVEWKEEISNVRSFSAKDLPSDDYTCSYYVGGNELKFELNIINLDPQFALQEIKKVDTDVFTVNPMPTSSIGHIYIWRQDDKFISRKKFPTLTLDFRETEQVELKLTMHLEGYEALYSLTVTKEELLDMAANAK